MTKSISTLDLARVIGGAGVEPIQPKLTPVVKKPKRIDWRDAPMGSWDFEDEK